MNTTESVMQDWVSTISFMQQSVLLTAVRGPDGIPKYGAVKMLLRWYRRCILKSSFFGRVMTDPIEPDGGSFLGASLDNPDDIHGEIASGDGVSGATDSMSSANFG